MVRMIVGGLAIGLLICLTENPSVAQSNFNLIPPAIGTSLRFACAESNDGLVRIIRTSTSYEARKIGSAKNESENSERLIEIEQEDQELEVKKVGDTNMVMHEYTITVPYTVSVTKDGKTVQESRTRTETRRRQMIVEDAENKKMVTYKTRAPVTQTVVEDGKTLTSTFLRSQTRTQIIDKDKELFQVLSPVTTEFEPDKLLFFDLKGRKIKPKTALDRLGERTPVVLLDSEEPVGEFFYSILKPNTILIFDPSSSGE